MHDILVHIDDYSVAQIKNDICIKCMCDGAEAIFNEAEMAGGLIARAVEEELSEITIAFPKPQVKTGKKSKKKG